jgi:septum formation protein
VLVLASASPRRSQLLKEWGYDFRLVHAPITEKMPPEVSPETGVKYLASQKAEAGFKVWRKQNGFSQDVILGADTIVVFKGNILGKPRDENEALRMLRDLSGSTHRVLTAISLAQEDLDHGMSIQTEVETTIVSFRSLSLKEIYDYIATGEPMDKAAAYGIQGGAGKFVKELKGSFTNVMGLPMELLEVKLKEKGILPQGGCQ